MKFAHVKPPRSALFWAVAGAATAFVASGYSIPPPVSTGTKVAVVLPKEPTAALRSAEPARPLALRDEPPEPDPSLNSIGPALP
jgi:hypothetical protein